MNEPMEKFVKKPVVVEAFQMTKERRWDNKDWPGWLSQAWNKVSPSAEGAMWCDREKPHEQLYIGTLEGVLKVSFGDWIIRGVKGEIYPCKPDIFEATYEKARSLMSESHVAEVQAARDEWDRPAAPVKSLAELAKSKGWKLKYALFNPLQVIMEFESEAKTRAFLESNKLSRRGSLE